MGDYRFCFLRIGFDSRSFFLYNRVVDLLFGIRRVGRSKSPLTTAIGKTAQLCSGIWFIKENSMKDTYETPDLLEYGTVEELTQTGNSSPYDATQSASRAF